MDLRDIAVTVREMPGRKYQWVLLEGTGETGVFAHYAKLQESERLYTRYADALVAGVSTLRVLAGGGGPRRRGSWDTGRY